MSSFDLNIQNYTPKELLELFELPPHYTSSMLEMKEGKLRENIMRNQRLDKDMQIKTLSFLRDVKNILLMQLKEQKVLNDGSLYGDQYEHYYQLQPAQMKDSPAEHPVQTRYEKPYTSSYPSNFYPGVVNPLKKKVSYKNLVIDTRFRDNYFSTSSTHFQFTLPTQFNNVVEMNLVSIQMPLSYYAISKQYGNSFFTITVTPTAGTASTTVITIPDGNYDAYSVITAINTELQAAGTPFSLVAFNVNLANGTAVNSLIGSGQTLVGEITAGTVSAIELNFVADRYGVEDRNIPLPLKLGWMLGFRGGLYVDNLNYVSEGVVDVSGPKYLYLILDDHNNNVSKNFYSALNSSILNNNILAQLSVGNLPAFTLQNKNLLPTNAPMREYFGPVNLQNVSIQLVDEYGRIVSLNNMDYSFNLTLTTLYDL
jgi:hypothetical protein